MALFEVDNFEGTIITDLFGDTAYFQDPDLFWMHQNKAIATAVSEWKAEGWSEIVVMERGEHFTTWEHGKRAMEQGGKIFLAIGHDGSVTPHIGYLSNADIKKIDAILKTGGAADAPAKTDKPEMSGPLCDYVALHRHAAIRACLLDHPSVALRLTVAHMLVGSDLWQVAPQKRPPAKRARARAWRQAEGPDRFAEANADGAFELSGLTPSESPCGPAQTLSKPRPSPNTLAKLSRR